MSSFKKDFKNRPQHDTDKSRDAFIKQANTRFEKALDKKKGGWHSIGAGRVGDSYKGGTIKKIDAKNAKAFVD